MRRRSRIGSAARTSSPSTVMLPLSASISRLASRSSVVLPEPEPPTMARNSPSATSSETSSTARTRSRRGRRRSSCRHAQGDQWRGGVHGMGLITPRSGAYRARRLHLAWMADDRVELSRRGALTHHCAGNLKTSGKRVQAGGRRKTDGGRAGRGDGGVSPRRCARLHRGRAGPASGRRMASSSPSSGRPDAENRRCSTSPPACSGRYRERCGFSMRR